MKINNIDLNKFGCRCKKFLPDNSQYKNNLTKTSFINFIPSEFIEELRDIDAEFIFYGNKDTIQKNISVFIEKIKNSIIKSGFNYKVSLESSDKPSVITNNSCLQKIKLNLIDMYEDEKSITTTKDTSININSPKPCYANLELTANTNVISYTLKINDNEIVVNNIKGNETVYIGSGKVIAGEKSKINDVDIWEFPILKPGSNTITVSRSDVNLKIKYCERW